jgi:hypothetical protein
MMWRVTATSGQAFRMTIGKVIHLQQRPGLYLAGKIESGIVCVGDRLNLVDGETVVREVTCDAVEFVDVDMHRPELALIAVLDKSLVPGDAREGQTLASVPPANGDADTSTSRSYRSQLYRRPSGASPSVRSSCHQRQTTEDSATRTVIPPVLVPGGSVAHLEQNDRGVLLSA